VGEVGLAGGEFDPESALVEAPAFGSVAPLLSELSSVEAVSFEVSSVEAVSSEVSSVEVVSELSVDEASVLSVASVELVSLVSDNGM
jgi:hypothetical protein